MKPNFNALVNSSLMLISCICLSGSLGPKRKVMMMFPLGCNNFIKELRDSTCSCEVRCIQTALIRIKSNFFWSL